MNVRKAVFLDRDGTINVEKEYLYRIEEFEFLPGVIEALHLLQDAAFILIIITNQSGIARGYYTEEDFEKLSSWMIDELLSQGISIAAIYHCPHHPTAAVEKYRVDCDCRKPKLGMYEQAIKDYNLDINNCFVIGDKIRDCSICETSNCHGYLISTNEKPEVIAAVKNGDHKNVEYAIDLREAAEKIIATKQE